MERSRRIRDWTGLEELRGELTGYLARRCRDANEVDDVVQETFLRAARYRRGLADGARLRAWVFRIAANVQRDRARREGQLPRLRAGEEALVLVEGREPAPGEPADDAHLCLDGVVLERAEAVAELTGALGQLARADRAALGPFYGGDGDGRRTAAECGLPGSLVKVRLFRARQRLLEKLRRRLAQERHRVAAAGVRTRRRLVRLRSGGLVALAVLGGALGGPALAGAGGAGQPEGIPTLPPAGRPAAAVVASPRPPSQAVGRTPSAREQLALARSVRFAQRGARGAALVEARTRAVEAFRAVRRAHPGTPEACEAAFRAGELLRASGDLDGARRELELAAADGGVAPFRERARLELGHIDRRAGRFQEALVHYERVTTDARARAKVRDRAALWAGRAHAELGRPRDAERVWTRVAEGSADALVRVRAYDLVALSFVRRGDLEGAAGVLERCRASLVEVANERTRYGRRVADALRTMRAFEAIRRAVDERTAARAGADAR